MVAPQDVSGLVPRELEPRNGVGVSPGVGIRMSVSWPRVSWSPHIVLKILLLVAFSGLVPRQLAGMNGVGV